MTEKADVTGWRARFLVVTEMMKGILPGLAMCLLTGVAARAMPGPETYLPAQDITISGRVTAPTCQARLDTDALKFRRPRPRDGTVTRGEAGAAQGEDGNRQVMRLLLSECEFDGLGLMFKAESLPGFPSRGGLRSADDNVLNNGAWYSVGPGTPENRGEMALTPAPDSAALDRGPGGETYFRLNQEMYWFGLSATLKGEESMSIPFEVRMHYAGDGVARKQGELLSARFTLQVSYR